jgi:uncharacterized protein (TIGR02145 family)
MKIPGLISISTVIIATSLFCSCEKEDPISVTTNSVSYISTTLAFGGGDVSGDNGSSVTARGVCWSLSPEPTLSDAYTVDGSGEGSFTSTLSGLTFSEIYYVRAYASNSGGTVYGKEVEFDNTWGESGVFIDSRDGAREYEWVRIGSQIWMAENLAYLPSVTPPTVFSYLDPHYYVYNYEGVDINSAKLSDYYKTYGVLYNWTAARTACPAGWHLPTDYEWMVLEESADGLYTISSGQWDRYELRGWDAGIKLRTTSGWNNNGNGTNLSGFSALPGGILSFGDSFIGTGLSGVWWTSSEYDTYKYQAIYRYLVSNYVQKVGRYWLYQNNGLSVRCVMDN